MNDKPRYIVTSKSAYLAMLCTSPVLLATTYYTTFNQGIGAWICAGLIVLAIRPFWRYRTHVWFWIIGLLAISLQIPLILFVPWGDRNLTGISLLPLGLLDYAAVFGCFKLVERMVEKNRPNDKNVDVEL